MTARPSQEHLSRSLTEQPSPLAPLSLSPSPPHPLPSLSHTHTLTHGCALPGPFLPAGCGRPCAPTTSKSSGIAMSFSKASSRPTSATMCALCPEHPFHPPPHHMDFVPMRAHLCMPGLACLPPSPVVVRPTERTLGQKRLLPSAPPLTPARFVPGAFLTPLFLFGAERHQSRVLPQQCGSDQDALGAWVQPRCGWACTMAVRAKPSPSLCVGPF